MPTPPAVPGVLKVIWKQIVGSDSSIGTRLHFTYTGTAPSDATCLLLAEQFWLAYSNNLTPLLNETYSMDAVDVIDMTSDTSGSAAYTASAAGSRGGGDIPAAVAALVNMTIARRYRGGKPRVYWPFGVSTDFATPQSWSTGFTSAFNTQYPLFTAACLAISEGGCVISGLVNVSLYKGFVSAQNPLTLRWRSIPTYRTGSIPVDPVLSSVLNAKPGSQRRRNEHST